jgi:excisionase family DNA binding protein
MSLKSKVTSRNKIEPAPGNTPGTGQSVVLSNRKNPVTYIVSPDDLDGPAAARALGITRRTLRRWCAEKPPRLTFTRIGTRKVRFRRQVIEYYLASREVRGRYHVEVGSGQ